MIPSASRGRTNTGWLKSAHSFSFGYWYDPERVHFGALRVINDDWVAPGEGFSTHSHENMEIISIPLSGALSHRDSTGNESTIQKGDVQVMSAGTGISHSEWNHSKETPVEFLQIWIVPNLRQVKPRYEQRHFDFQEGKWTKIVSPMSDHSEATKIYQEAFLYWGVFSNEIEIRLPETQRGWGTYLMMIEGQATIAEHKLSKRDALEIPQNEQDPIEINCPAQVLLIQVPLSLDP